MRDDGLGSECAGAEDGVEKAALSSRRGIVVAADVKLLALGNSWTPA